MILSYILYVLLGVIENVCAILYYKTAQKNHDFACAMIDLVRGGIWLFVVSVLITNIKENLPLGICYIVGCSLGDYIALKLEPYIEKVILKVKNRGRKKKRWFLQGDKKQ